MLERSPSSRRGSRTRGPAWLALAAFAGAILGAIGGCSTADCKSMKGGGSLFGDLVCGGQGTDAPEPDAPRPNACTDVRLLMPAFFKLLEDPNRPLASLRDAVRTLGAPQCLDKQRRSCTPDDACPVGDCGADGLCPCQSSYSPLADLLVITFRGLAGIASANSEPGAPTGTYCVSPALASQLLPAQINRSCEIRRMLDVLLRQNGGQKLLEDANVQRVVRDLLRYVEGKADGVPHYDLFTTLGRMAQNPGICAPSDAYDLLDRALAYYTPARSAQDLGAIQDLIADPQTRSFLAGLGTGGSAQGRQSVVTLIHDLSGTVTSAANGPAATRQIDDLLQKIVYPYIEKSQGQAYENKVKAAVAALERALSEQAGLFPFLQKLLTCASNPIIDNGGELIGALYDLVSLQSKDGSTIDLATLVGSLKTLLTLDSTGQVGRSLRLVIQGARDDEAATTAVRELLAKALTPDIAQKLLPPLDLLVQKQVLGEVLALLDDLLYGCTPPTQH